MYKDGTYLYKTNTVTEIAQCEFLWVTKQWIKWIRRKGTKYFFREQKWEFWKEERIWEYTGVSHNKERLLKSENEVIIEHSHGVVWSLSCIWILCLSMGLPMQEYWRGLSFPSPGDLSDPRIEPMSPTLQVDSLPIEPPRKPRNTEVGSLFLLQRIFLTQELNQDLL